MVFTTQKTFQQKFVPRKLAERSHLLFEFPQPNNRSLQTYLPFLENCEVTEAKRANLTSYDLLSRSSSLYAYMGAKARVFNVKFNLTFLNIIDYIGREGLDDRFKQQFRLFWETKEEKMKAFYLYANGFDDATITKFGGQPVDHAKIERDYYQKLTGIRFNEATLFDEVANFAITKILGIDNYSPNLDQERYNDINKIINLVVFWINLIRTSVLNNSKNTTLGPPIIRLTHGILYNDVPCVADSYNIRIVNDAGFDVQTMLPKQLEISLTLNEVRVGNFGEYQAKKIVDRDNNTGWESVITDNLIDPGAERI